MSRLKFHTMDRRLGVEVGTVEQWSRVSGFPEHADQSADFEAVTEWASQVGLLHGKVTLESLLTSSESVSEDAGSVDEIFETRAEPLVEHTPDSSVAEPLAVLPILHPQLGARCGRCGLAAPCMCGLLKPDYSGEFMPFDPQNPEHSAKVCDVEWVTVRVPIVRRPTAKLSANPSQGLRLSASENEIRLAMAQVYDGCMQAGVRRTVGHMRGKYVDGVSGMFKFIFEAVAAAAQQRP